jgi:uncharacterized protein
VRRPLTHPSGTLRPLWVGSSWGHMRGARFSAELMQCPITASPGLPFGSVCRSSSVRGFFPPFCLLSLLCACANLARYLLDKGAHVNAQDHNGSSPLLWAAYHGKTPVVVLLLERGGDPRAKSTKGSTPLMGSSYSGHTDIVRVRTDQRPPHPNPPHPFHLVLTPSSPLLSPQTILASDAGAATINEVDARGSTAMWWACDKGRSTTIRLLLRAGADATIPDHEGVSPMDLASSRGHDDCFEILKVRGRWRRRPK